MSVVIQEINSIEDKELPLEFIGELPLWIRSEFVKFYEDKMNLIAFRGNKVVGILTIPLVKNENMIFAKRIYRLFPYSSPFLVEKDNLKRREVIYHFLEYLSRNVDELSLPLSPFFYDIAEFSSLGVIVEMRHTHILKGPIKLQEVNNRLRNHINSALKSIKIEIARDLKKFNFALAIKGSESEQKLRMKLATRLLKSKSAIIFSAKTRGKLCAGILLMYDSNTAYMLHSWQSKDTPRGTISALIYEATNWTFKNKLQNFDFEGSVINDIDYFFSGFNAQITPYGFLHWAKNQKQLYKLINKSIEIEGRIKRK